MAKAKNEKSKKRDEEAKVQRGKDVGVDLSNLGEGEVIVCHHLKGSDQQSEGRPWRDVDHQGGNGEVMRIEGGEGKNQIEGKRLAGENPTPDIDIHATLLVVLLRQSDRQSRPSLRKNGNFHLLGLNHLRLL